MPEISSFDFARMAALKQYSDLERELCLVMKYALGSDYQAAAIVLYGITNTRARYAIIGNLLATRAEGKFRKSWEWIERKLGPCDTARNQLVHWSEEETILIKMRDPENLEIASIDTLPMLQHPATRSPRALKHYEKDIWPKRDEMRVMLHIVNRFHLSMVEPLIWPWLDIFQQPISDQTPTELLQRLNGRGDPAPLPPYPQKQLRPRVRSEDDDRRPDVQVQP